MLTPLRRHFAPALAVLVLFVFSFATGPVLQAQSAESASPHGLEGAWWVTVTLYNCATGAKRPPFSSMLMFSRGGTVTENTQNSAFQPGQRSVGLGTWSKSENGKYTASDIAFIQFTTPAFTLGTQKLDHSITVADDGNTFTDDAAVQFFDASGNLLISACATATGNRLD